MTRNLSSLLALAVLFSACASPNTSYFGADVGTIAREVQNPVSKLTRAGLESNVNFNYGTNEDDVQVVENVKATLPMVLDDDFNVVNVLKLPVISQPELGAEDSEFGLGNMQWTAWMTVDDETSGVFAFGPLFRFPTNTADVLGKDSFAAGFSMLMLRRPGNWVIGLGVGGVWNVPGNADDEDKTGELGLAPFINYNLEGGWYWTSTPTIVADYERDSSNRWMIPVGGGIGRVVQFGAQPVNLTLQAFWNVEHPEPDGGDYSVVFDVQMLYTKRGWRGK